jgi:tRNA nucleotidyltransferase (CCA-adding enzyme)
LAEVFGVRAHLIGAAPRRVWRVEAPDLKVEIWPRGALDLEWDIKRRDFSCNALMWKLPGGPLIDRVGGVRDIEQLRLRAISQANLEQDPVRLVRGPRFLAHPSGFTLERTTAAWIRALAPSLTAAPRERVGQELLKLLTAPLCDRGLQALLDLELLEPAAPPGAATEAGWLAANIETSSRLAGATTHPLPAALREAGDAARLALLLRAWGRPSAGAVADYAWPRETRRHATRAATQLEAVVEGAGAPAADRRFLIHVAGPSFPAAIALAAAVRPERPWRRWWRLWQQHGSELVAPEPFLSGLEVMEILDLAPGEQLGSAFRAVITAQIRQEVRSKEGARRWLRKWQHEENNDESSSGGVGHENGRAYDSGGF